MVIKHSRGRPSKASGRQTVQDILRAAAGLAAADQLTMRAVSQEANVQPGTIYTHFGNRAGLLGAVQDAVGPGVVIRLSEGLHSPEDLPAFCAAVAAAWASPLSRLAYSVYRQRGGLPCSGNLDDLPADLRPDVRRALRRLEQRTAQWAVPIPPQELAWRIIEPLLLLREHNLCETEQVAAAWRHGEQLRIELAKVST